MRIFSRRFAAAAVFLFSSLVYAQTTRTVSAGQSIQDAINASASGDIINVGAGTYTEHLVITGKSVILKAATGVTLSPGSAGPAITISGAAASSTSVDGFTISGAGKPTTANGPQGGIAILNGSPTIKNSVLTGNYCAGIRSVSGTPTITGNRISGTLNDTSCTAGEGRGSAIAINGSDPTSTFYSRIASNTIFANTASVSYSPSGNSALLAGGGGININGANGSIIVLNDIHGNVSTGYGGAVYMDTTPGLFFLNNLVYGNRGLSGGLDIVIPSNGTQGILANNTIADNTATSTNAGTDVYIGGNLSLFEFVNNIVAGYSSGQATIACGALSGSTPIVVNNNDLYSFTSTTAIASSCTPFTQASTVNANLSVNPQFAAGTAANVTAGTASFRLQSTSPLIDYGNNSIYNVFGSIVPSFFPAPLLDIDGNPRFVGTNRQAGSVFIDMGAYEYQGSGSGTGLTGHYLVDTELTPSTYTPIIGQSLVLTAMDYHSDGSSTSGDTISFYQDNVLLGSTVPDGSGKGTYTISAFPSGTHRYYAYAGSATAFSYSFDLNLLGKAATLKATTTTLVAAPNPANAGQTVTLTATIAPVSGTIPAGTVYFIDGATTLGNSALDTTSGTATYSGTFAVGTHSLTAAFVPTDTSSYNGSTGTTTLVVNGAVATATLSMSPAAGPYAPSQALSFTATVSGSASAPTGTVVFSVDNVVVNTATLVAGSSTTSTATYSGVTLAAGSHTVTCSYSGDTNYGAVGCTPNLAFTVTQAVATATLSSVPASTVTYGNSFALTSAVSGASGVPTGTVTFFADGTALGSGTLAVVGASTTTSSASFSSGVLPAGNHTLSCTYNGDSSYASVACTPSLSATVSPLASTTTLTSSVSPAQALAPFTVPAKVVDSNGAATSGAPVTLHQSNAADQQATTNAAGLASFTVSSAVNSVSFQAVTAAAGNYGASAAATLTVPVLPNATTGTMIVQPTSAYEGQAVSAVVSILNTSSAVTAAGSVTIFDGTTSLSTMQLPASVVGQALTSVTFSLTTLAAGSHNLSAVYTPTVNFTTSTAIAGTSITILPSGFTLTADPSITIQTEHHKAFTATVTSVGNFSGKVTLSFVGTLPPVLTPTFARNPLAVPANGSASTAVNLETDAIANFYAWLPLALLPLACRKRTRKLAVMAAFTVFAIFPLSGCSGHYPNHTPPGTYDLTLQASGTGPSGNVVTQTVHVALIVTP